MLLSSRARQITAVGPQLRAALGVHAQQNPPYTLRRCAPPAAGRGGSTTPGRLREPRDRSLHPHRPGLGVVDRHETCPERRGGSSSTSWRASFTGAAATPCSIEDRHRLVQRPAARSTRRRGAVDLLGVAPTADRIRCTRGRRRGSPPADRPGRPAGRWAGAEARQRQAPGFSQPSGRTLRGRASSPQWSRERPGTHTPSWVVGEGVVASIRAGRRAARPGSHPRGCPRAAPEVPVGTGPPSRP